MKALLLISLSIFTISSTLTAATYVNTSGFIQDIFKTSGYRHPYSGENLSPYADLAFAELHRADLSFADLHGATLSGANLYKARLIGADLTGANLYEANLYEANLFGADLTGANLIGADLTGANLIYADLAGANLIYADLIGADFYAAWLDSTDFSHADLSNVSNVDTAFWRNSNLYGATLPDGFDQAWFESEGAIFLVPEPSNFTLLFGALVLGFAALRRR